MNNSIEFINATNIVKKLVTTPTNNEQGKLYGLYKQATIGNNTTSKPSMFDFKANKKYTYWNVYMGYSKYEAEVEYITTVNELINKYKLEQ